VAAAIAPEDFNICDMGGKSKVQSPKSKVQSPDLGTRSVAADGRRRMAALFFRRNPPPHVGGYELWDRPVPRSAGRRSEGAVAVMQDFEIGTVEKFFGQHELVFKCGEERVALDDPIHQSQVQVGTEWQGLLINLSTTANEQFATAELR